MTVRGAVRASTVRRANLGLVARTVCSSVVPLSRAALATATDMNRSTISRLADDLVAGGVLDELRPPASVGPGRPAVPLTPGSRLVALGLEVNVGHLVARAYDLAGTLVAQELEEADLAASRPEPVLARLEQLSAGVLASCPGSSRVVGAGLSLPGITAEDRLVWAPNLQWVDVRPSDWIDRDALGGAVLRVGNDANLSARVVAEPRPGCPGDLRDFLYVCGEAGIGGATVVDGEPVTGRHGWAGEIGHLLVDPAGEACPCGSAGCLEQYAGLRAMLVAAGLPAAASVDVLLGAIGAGDRAALLAVGRAARALGLALSAAVNVLDIPDVVLGGHLAVLAEHLRPELEHELARRVVTSRWTPPRVHRDHLDVAPGATGAAFEELRRVIADPSPWVDPVVSG